MLCGTMQKVNGIKRIYWYRILTIKMHHGYMHISIVKKEIPGTLITGIAVPVKKDFPVHWRKNGKK